MNNLSIMADPTLVTSEWLTQVLNKNGYDARVQSFEYKQIGTGQMARCFRFSMEVEGDPDTPKSLIGKFNSADPATRDRAAEGGAYAAELNFYSELAPNFEIATPRCFCAEIDESGRDFTLLLEDMSPAVQGDQLKGCSLAVAEQAVDQLATLHATTWNDETLQGASWLPSLKSHLEMSRDGLKVCAPEFIKRMNSLLEPDVLALVDRMANNFDKLTPLIEQHSGAVIHYDYRADNLLINEAVQPPEVTAVDWQTLAFGSPLLDVAYFIGASLPTESRRKNEMDLLKRYYDQLCSNGVADFVWDDCLQQYQLGSFSGLTMAVNAFVFVEETERGTKMFTTMAKRHAQQIIDLGADKFLT